MNPTDFICIDFECRKGRPPSLLGIRQDHKVAQWILEPALFGGVAARPGLGCSNLAAVADTLATDAEKRDCRFVGWSLFDRNCIVDSSDVSDRTKEIVSRRYLNAIEPAKRWRQRFRPGWEIAANELKLYFGATNFTPKLHRSIRPDPAQWNKHVQDQVQARDSYRNVTKQTKRDWHHLLIYNSDDCRGLQHVFEQTFREVALWNRYLTTTFHVDAEPTPVDIRIGWKRKKLDRLLKSKRVDHWAFLTAWNLGSKILPGNENHDRHRTLVKMVAQEGLKWLAGRGIGEDPGWPAEESLFVMGISELRARAIGKHFGQLAIVVGQKEQPSRLIPC